MGWLVETLRAAPEPVTLVLTGPLTNIAAAIEAAPDIVGMVRRVVALAGTHRQPGVRPSSSGTSGATPRLRCTSWQRASMTSPSWVWTPPSPPPSTRPTRTGSASLATPAGEAAGCFQRQRITLYGAESAPLHDPLAVALLLDEEVVRAEPAAVAVDLDPGPTYGRTAYQLGAVGSAVRVALDADRDLFLTVLCDALH